MRVQASALGVGAILLLGFAIGSLGQVPATRAQSSTNIDASGCDSIGGAWANSTSTCTLTSRLVLSQNYSIFIPSGATLVANAVTNYGGFRVLGSLFNNNGTFNNYGSIDNSGSIYNNGTFNNYPGSQLINEGDLINDKGGRFEDHGTIINTDPGTIHNNGTFFVDGDGTLSQYGTFWNLGFLINYGMVFNLGTINTSNDINNEGKIDNGGTIDNTDTINNFGTITNECNALLSNEPGSTYTGSEPNANQCTTSTPTSPTSTETGGNSTETGGNANDTGSSSDVPEFPYTVLTGVAFTLVLVFAYMAVRRRGPA